MGQTGGETSLREGMGVGEGAKPFDFITLPHLLKQRVSCLSLVVIVPICVVVCVCLVGPVAVFIVAMVAC